MARPRRQDARRAEIVSAAIRAISERGLIGLRLKDIAAQTGLSPGSIAYYYPDLDDLMLTVHQTAVDRFYNERRDAMNALADPVAQLGALADLGICDPEDPMWPTLYQLHVHSAREQGHADQMTRLFELEASLYLEVIVDGARRGDFSPQGSVDEIAATAVALEDGLGVHLVGRNRHTTPSTVRSMLRGYLSAVLCCPALYIDSTVPTPPSLRAETSHLGADVTTALGSGSGGEDLHP